MSGLQITTEPTQEPLSLQEVKEYLRVEDSTDERIIRPFIETARRICEEHTGRSLMTQTHSFFVEVIVQLVLVWIVLRLITIQQAVVLMQFY